MQEIVGRLERWLDELDPDDVLQRGFFDAPQLSLLVRGWELVFTAFTVQREARGRSDHRVLGMGSGMVGRVNDRDKLAAALAGKGGKYKPEEPFVLAVLLMSDGTVDHEDIEAALLGPIAYPIDPHKPGLGRPFASQTASGFEGTSREALASPLS